MDNTKIYKEYIESTYENLTELSQNEAGTTYLARHRQNGRIVVKKKVSVQAGKIYERLRKLDSPYLTKVLEVCFCDTYCIVIESYLSGETLEQKLENSMFFSEEETEYYILQILQCLVQIHSVGIVHRDLTPSNVLISTDDVVKLIDFGIARTPKENQNRDTTILGTVGYASPEQFGFFQTDARTDIYAIGILLNKMLTGKLPAERLTESKKFRKIVEKCIMIDPQKRYQTAEEIIIQIKPLRKRGNTGKEDETIWPGFRSNILWRKVVAITGYVFMLLSIVVFITEYGTTIQAFLLESAALSLYIVAPFLIGSNFGRWDRKWKPFSGMPKPLTITIRVMACMLFFILGTELESYVKYTLLQLPKP